MKKEFPYYSKHKSIIRANYSERDSLAGAGDAKYLSIGRATWAKDYKDYSAKVFRLLDEDKDSERWARGSEELPLWRVLDLALLVVSQITGKKSNLNEEITERWGIQEDYEDLKAFIQENISEYNPRLEELRYLLSNDSNDPTEEIPNIFNYATSELSQDAVIAWLISFADPSFSTKEQGLHTVGKSLLLLLLGKDSSFEIRSVKVGRQWKKIDVWVEVNDDIFLIIEDKTNTFLHDDQIEKYRKNALDYYHESRKIVCTYIKTGNDSLKTINDIREAGYIAVERHEMLGCLSPYCGNNTIVKHFTEYLQNWEKRTNSFRNTPLKSWCWQAWEGFYRELERRLSIYDWCYVANPSGGFLGIWWHWIAFDDGARMYLQIESPDKLCVKIEYLKDRENRGNIRDKYYYLLTEKARELGYDRLHHPARFGNGSYMTIGVVDLKDIIDEPIIDIEKTIEILKSYERLVDACQKE